MVSIYIYDIGFLIIFSLFVFLFLHKRRKNLKKEGIMYLYRTRVGIKFIDYVGTKYKKFLTVYAFLGVVVGYLLMASMIWFLYKLLECLRISPSVSSIIEFLSFTQTIPSFFLFISVIAALIILLEEISGISFPFAIISLT